MTTDVPVSTTRYDVEEWLLREDAVVAQLDNPASIEAREGYLRGIRVSADATWRDGIDPKEWRRKTRANYLQFNPVVSLILRWMIGRLIGWAIEKLFDLYTKHPEFCPHA